MKRGKISKWRSGDPITLDVLDEMLARLAALMRAQGEHGLAYLPIFERLERERESLASLDARLDLAIARGEKLKSKQRKD